jgi:hypothetical protein
MGHPNAGMRSRRPSQTWLLGLIQRDEPFVYALQTRENAIKVGCTGDLMQRKRTIGFGGSAHFLGFMPGDFEVERALHERLGGHRIPGSLEYYYPHHGILPVLNEMRAWMNLAPLTRRDLPRVASCTFHGRVLRAEVHGGPVLK